VDRWYASGAMIGAAHCGLPLHFACDAKSCAVPLPAQFLAAQGLPTRYALRRRDYMGVRDASYERERWKKENRTVLKACRSHRHRTAAAGYFCCFMADRKHARAGVQEKMQCIAVFCSEGFAYCVLTATTALSAGHLCGAVGRKLNPGTPLTSMQASGSRQEAAGGAALRGGRGWGAGRLLGSGWDCCTAGAPPDCCWPGRAPGPLPRPRPLPE
jgi:hypothetical protein